MKTKNVILKWTVLAGFTALLGLSAGCLKENPPVANPSHSAFRFVREQGGIREYELLANHLSVLLYPDRSTPVVTVMVTYRVGSRNETDGLRGSAHLLEHMMFKGTERHQKQKNTAIAAVLQRVGAHMNASTWTDGTNYYESLPSDHLDLALDIESDRMRSSLFRKDDLDSEMHVVHSELEKIENSPFAMLDQALMAAAYTTHPYHHPVIGYRADIEKATAEDLRKFYDTFYWPNNATLAVIGDFDENTILEKISGYFGKIPASPAPIPQTLPNEPAQTAPRLTDIRREDRIESSLIAHKTVPLVHADTPALDILCQILTGGKTSRLYGHLIEKGLAVDVRSEPSRSRDAGLMTTQALLAPGVPHAEVEDIILKTYETLREKGVTEQELAVAKQQMETHVLYSRDGSYSIANELSSLIAAGDWTYFTTYLARIRTLTVKDIQQAAQRYLVPATMTTARLISKNPSPREAVPEGLTQPAHAPHVLTETPETWASDIATPATLPKKPSALPPAGGQLSKRVAAAVIGPIQVLSIKTAIPEVVTILGSFEGGGRAYSKNPILPEITASLLDEGTRRRGKFEIAALLESRGAQIAFDLSGKRAGFKARCLSQDVPLVMELVHEQLREPLFEAAEFEKQKQRLLVSITNAMSSTSEQAEAALSRLIYAPAHPAYHPTFEKELEALKDLKLADVVRFHREFYSPKRMIVTAAGDIEGGDFQEIVRRTLGTWPEKKFAPLSIPVMGVLNEPKKVTVAVPDKSKFDVVMGHAMPLKLKDPDYDAAYLANFILGGDFSSRLSAKVRDDYGLTYSIYSEFHGIDFETTGDWQVNLILNPAFLDRGIEAALRELERFKDAGITAEELEENKTTLKGMFKVSLSTTEGLASRLLTNAENQRPLEDLDRYDARIDAVTLEKAQSAIARYFHPAKLQIAMAGPDGDKEKPPEKP